MVGLWGVCMSELLRFEMNSNYGENDTEGKRFSETINASSRKAEEHRSNAEASYREGENYTKAASLASNTSSNHSQNLNQDYVDWLGAKFDSGKISREEHSKALTGTADERSKYGKEFAKVQADKVRDEAPINSFKNSQEIKSAHERNATVIKGKGGGANNNNKQKVINKATGDGTYRNEVNGRQTQDKVTAALKNNKNKVQVDGQGVIDKGKNIKNTVEKKQDSSLAMGAVPDLVKNLPGSTGGIVKNAALSPFRDVGNMVTKPLREVTDVVTKPFTGLVDDAKSIAKLTGLSGSDKKPEDEG